MDDVIDILIIGGGINGTAIAADAAGRGLSVLLCEKNDLSSGTSSASSKLIHGGLRYLELYEFNLVRKALKEREILMRRAPNLIRPLEFVLPHDKHLRPAWLIRLGLFLYDHLSKRNILPGSHGITLKNNLEGKSLQPNFKKGFTYYDCFTDDARLVILNALSAQKNHAILKTRTEFISAVKEKLFWKVTLKDHATQTEKIYHTKGIINVAGPWVNEVQEKIEPSSEPLSIKLDKGSHIIIPKLYEGDFAYILQNTDDRIVFTIPFETDFTLIGTTDIAYKKNLHDIKINSNEIDYLCQAVNHYFVRQITPADIIWSYAGVRCLQSESKTRVSKLTRDYKFILNANTSPFLLTVIGGKLTTHRTLAEEAVNLLKSLFPNMQPAWTASQALPGCDFLKQNVELFYQQFCRDFSWLPERLARRYAKNYGTLAYPLLADCKKIHDLGEKFSADLYEKEVKYLIENEWAKTVDDILWRRTKLGLFFRDAEKKQLTDWLEKQSLS